jgi:hypothetical protein
MRSSRTPEDVVGTDPPPDDVRFALDLLAVLERRSSSAAQVISQTPE